MGIENVTSSVKDMRETYYFLALIFTHPFRGIDNLKDTKSGLLWTKSVTLRDTYQLKDEGLEILQNIQDQTQCKKLKFYGDELSRVTKEPIGNDVNCSRFDEEEDGLSPEDLSI